MVIRLREIIQELDEIGYQLTRSNYGELKPVIKEGNGSHFGPYIQEGETLEGVVNFDLEEGLLFKPYELRLFFEADFDKDPLADRKIIRETTHSYVVTLELDNNKVICGNSGLNSSKKTYEDFENIFSNQGWDVVNNERTYSKIKKD